VPYQWGTSCLVVDTGKVTRPITKWADLWDPEFKDKVVLLDDEREVLGMVLSVLGYDKNSTDPAQLDAAKQKFIELKPNVKLFDSDSPKTALLAGDVWLGQTWNGEAALAHQENPDIAYIIPEEGCTVWYDNLAIPKGAPHKSAATAFINYVLDPQASILITQEFPYSNPNKAALDLMKTQDPEMYNSYMGFSATNPSAEDTQRLHMIKDVGDATALWDRVWTEVKGGEYTRNVPISTKEVAPTGATSLLTSRNSIILCLIGKNILIFVMKMSKIMVWKTLNASVLRMIWMRSIAK
jgi:spermidine/putrescine-binding protein